MANQKNQTDDKTTGSQTSTTGTNGKDASLANDSSLINQAKSAAGDVYESVADKAASTIDEQKAGLTGRLTGVADTVRRLSGTLHETEADDAISGYAAKYTDTAAQKIESIAKYFDSSEMKDIARDLESYARRNPAVFLGSAFAIGIMAARFLKSSPPADVTVARAASGAARDEDAGARGGQKPAASAAPTGF